MGLAIRPAEAVACRAGVAARLTHAGLGRAPVDLPPRAWRWRAAAARTVRTLAVPLLATALAIGTAHAAPACEIEGEPVQWAADVCMRVLQTDDEIAASDCLAAEAKRRFADDCAAKRHYKQRLCALSIRRGARTGDLAACIADPGFKGRTVASGGVGG